MTTGEPYSQMRAPLPCILRVDGRNFRDLLDEMGAQRPHDRRFAEAMVGAVRRFFEASGFSPRLGYTFSDEVDLVFAELPFDARVEKVVSVAAAFMASALTELARPPRPLAFDARVVHACPGEVQAYLASRQAEAWRNHLQGHAYYALRADGMSPQDSAQRLSGLSADAIHEMLFRRGVNLGTSPAWQRRGVAVWREAGALKEDWEPPAFAKPEGEEFLRRVLGRGLVP